MTKGFKTTEFAFLVLFTVLNVLAVLAGKIADPTLASIAVAVVGAAYAVARGMAKQNKVNPDSMPKPGDK